MNEYFRALLSAMMLMSGLFAQVASRALPDSFAAVLGIVLAMVWGRHNDHVTKHFRSDVDRILGDDHGLMLRLFRSLVVGLVIATLLAPIMGAGLAAVAGFALILLIASVSL